MSRDAASLKSIKKISVLFPDQCSSPIGSLVCRANRSQKVEIVQYEQALALLPWIPGQFYFKGLQPFKVAEWALVCIAQKEDCSEHRIS